MERGPLGAGSVALWLGQLFGEADQAVIAVLDDELAEAPRAVLGLLDDRGAARLVGAEEIVETGSDVQPEPC